MCADIYTKAFTDASKWEAACELINIVDPKRLHVLLKSRSVQHKDDSTLKPRCEAEGRRPTTPSSQRGGVPLCGDDRKQNHTTRNIGYGAIFAGAPANDDEFTLQYGVRKVPKPNPVSQG